ncbi:MAG: ABC transporter ATP-binding protein [Rhodospirillales bacterium]
MLSNLKSAVSAVEIAPSYYRFLRRERAVTRSETMWLIVLPTLTVLAESAGVVMLVPILSFVQNDRNIDAFAADSWLGTLVVDVHQLVGLEVSLLTLCLASFMMILARQLANYFNGIEIERVKSSIARRLCINLFATVMASQAANIRRYKPGHFVQSVDHECQATATIMVTFSRLWMQFVTLAAYGAVLFSTEPVASAVSVLVIVIVMLCMGTLIRIANRLSKTVLHHRRSYLDFMIERFHAWKLIKLNGTLELERDWANQIQRNLVDSRIQMIRTQALMALIFIPVIMAFLFISLYILLDVLLLDVATISTFALVLIRLMPVSQSVQYSFNQFATYLPLYEAVRSDLETAQRMPEATGGDREIVGLKEGIRFENVSFCYESRDEAALRDVTLTIPAGSFTAIIGPSGAGKSTLVDLIAQIIRPNEGTIFVDGIPAQEFRLKELRAQFHYVTQTPFLFDASVEDNVRYSRRDASDDDVRNALEFANAAEFVDELPDGIETSLGPGGDRLSGGQKQRIVLARAFLANTSVLILDEPTSALDNETETVVQNAIDTLQKSRNLTVIVIAHRLSTIRNADQVVQLKDGRLHKVGTASEVLEGIDELEAVIGGHDTEDSMHEDDDDSPARSEPETVP